MATDTKKTGGRRVLRIAGIAAGVLLVLLVVLYFIVTSSWFLQTAILPRVSDSINADVTISSASISPFSQVVLNDLSVKPRGQETLLVAPEVRARYSLMKILGGNMVIHEVSVQSPTVTIFENPDGSSNLDPILKSLEEEPGTAEEETSEPLQLDLGKLAISNGTLLRTTEYEGPNRDLIEISKLNLDMANIGNNQVGQAKMGADVLVQNDPPAPGTNGSLTATLNGTFEIGLTQDLMPSQIQGNSRFTVTGAKGGLAQAEGLAAELDSNLTQTELRQLLLRFTKGNANLGQIRAQGPFSMEKQEGQIALAVEGIDQQLLSIATAGMGLEFGKTAISSTNLLTLAKSGEEIGLRGRFLVNQFQVIRTNEATPPLDFRAEYNVAVDQSNSLAVLRTFNLAGEQNGSTFLRGDLSSPMTISWGDTTNAVGNSELSLVVTNLNLTNWNAFVGTTVPEGLVNALLTIQSAHGGGLVTFDLNTRLENLTLIAGTNRITQAGATLQARGQAVEFSRFQIPQLGAELRHRGQPAARLNGGGNYNSEQQTADFQLNGSASLPRVLQVIPQPEASFSSGDALMNVRLTMTQDVRNVTGFMGLTNLTGSYASNAFRSYHVASEVDLGMAGDHFDIRRAAGRVLQGGNPGGSFLVTGSYNLSNETGRVSGKLENFNQHGLGPFLQAQIGEKELTSVNVGGSFTAEMPATNTATLKADLVMTNLVVRDPKQKTAVPPLEARMHLEATKKNNLAEVQNTYLQLSPTQLASNIVHLTARVDMSLSNVYQGTMKLRADALDLTRYYDIYESDAEEETTEPAETASGESEPIDVPLTNFLAEASIGRLYLRELEITNLQSTVRIDGGRIQLKPFQMAINGAPVEAVADINVGVPGYRYDASFSARQVPFAPLVNTFSPEQKGRLGGTLTAVGKVKGGGTTGASLRTNFTANFDIGTTNLNLEMREIKSPLLKSVVNVVAILPELKKNPTAAAGSLLGAVLGSSGKAADASPEWLQELQESPIDVIEGRGSAAKGQVELARAFVQSRAFQASTSGTIGIANELTNSTLNLPLSIALRRYLAEKINMIPAGTPTNAAYVPLPDYVTIRGTVSDPKADINKMAILGTALEQLGGNIPGVDQKTGNLIQGLGGILTGRTPPASTNQPAAGTNAPARPQLSPGGFLNQLLRPATNQPSSSGTNQPPATNTSPLGGLLDQLRRGGNQ